MTYFWNFGTTFISRERFELETSNLACRLTIGGTNDKNEKSKGVGKGHVTYFCSIGSQILYIFETHGIGQTPSSLERYLVVCMFCMYRFSLWLYVKVSACHALMKATYLLTYLLYLQRRQSVYTRV